MRSSYYFKVGVVRLSELILREYSVVLGSVREQYIVLQYIAIGIAIVLY